MYQYLPIIIFPRYVKKEDAKDVLKTQKTYLAFFSLGMAIVMGVMSFFVLPKLVETYSVFGIQRPLITQMFGDYSPFLIVGLIVLSIYFFMTKKYDSQFEEKLTKYKAGEMIKTKELMKTDLQWGVVILLVICIGWTVAALIQPIYNLTNIIN